MIPQQPGHQPVLSQKKAARARPSQQKAENFQPQPPGQRLNASIVRYMKAPLGPVPLLPMAPGTPRYQRASSKCCKCAQFSPVPVQPAIVSPSKERDCGKTQPQEIRKIESSKKYLSPGERDRKSLRGTTSAYTPDIPVLINPRDTRFANGENEYAGRAVGVERMLEQKVQQREKKQSQAGEQGAARTNFMSVNLDKRRSGLRPNDSSNVVEANKAGDKQSGSTAAATKMANLVVPVQGSGRATGPPKTSATSLPTASTGNVVKAPLLSPKTAKDMPLLAASSAAIPADPYQKKKPSACSQGDVEGAGMQRYSGWPVHPQGSTATTQLIRDDVHGPKSGKRASKFDPFKTPSVIVEELAEVSEASFMPPRFTTLPQKMKYLSSLPGFHETVEMNDPQIRAVVNAERDHIVTMQVVAAFCVIAAMIATLMFIAYYFLWSIDNKEQSFSTPLIAHDANSENNYTLPVFLLYSGHTKVV
ncbi:hypothetical protein HPB51_027982 [Rhipicephalus microplus]|uniref:Uncharacterized protein n=1 Tax=Rhipicephalus microplus TaxID=6941 RepID=A0A9J6CYL3_RHIMP|nr:hypothetical protein HPB51_027982 [Rhipicephalus microplus]